MARTVRNLKIDTRTARVSLNIRREPYWTVISDGCAIGYRKGKRGGTWIARWRSPEGGQQYQALGTADDVRDPNGATVLSFKQAQQKARDWFDEQEKDQAAEDGPYTVQACIDDYVTWLESEGRATAADSKSRAAALILPDLGSIEVKDLTTAGIRNWRDKLATSPARKRRGKDGMPKYREQATTEDEIRARRSTVNRTLTILKAALNHAFNEGKTSSDLAWRRVKPYKGVDAARVRFLTLKEAKRLINACEPSIRRLVKAALLTGARYSELAHLKVKDFHADSGTVFIAKSKNMKARYVTLTDEGTQFFASVALRRANRDSFLFVLEDGRTWGPSYQARPMAEACRNAKIKPAVTFHELRHTYASLSIMSGMTLLVLVKNLGHSDTRMVEKHYGHLADEYKTEMIRQTAPRFGLLPEARVAEI